MHIFVDGVFDFYHAGHQEHFKRVKHLYEDVQLTVGVISDSECLEYKRKPTMNEHMRLQLVSKDKNVDTAMVTPLIITRQFIKDNAIDFIYHAFATPEDESNQNECFAIPREMGIFKSIPYVKGISSTAILSEWEHIWQKKGLVNSDDLQLLNGYEGTDFDPLQSWEKIKKQLDIDPNDEILEVGCGAGYLAQHIENNYVGIDPSQSLILKHLQILNNAVCVSRAHNLPFADNSFDTVVMARALQAVKAPDELLLDMLRVAREAVITFPNFAHWQNRIHLIYLIEALVFPSVIFSVCSCYSFFIWFHI